MKYLIITSKIYENINPVSIVESSSKDLVIKALNILCNYNSYDIEVKKLSGLQTKNVDYLPELRDYKDLVIYHRLANDKELDLSNWTRMITGQINALGLDVEAHVIDPNSGLTIVIKVFEKYLYLSFLLTTHLRLTDVEIENHNRFSLPF